MPGCLVWQLCMLCLLRVTQKQREIVWTDGAPAGVARLKTAAFRDLGWGIGDDRQRVASG